MIFKYFNNCKYIRGMNGDPFLDEEDDEEEYEDDEDEFIENMTRRSNEETL